MLLVECRNFLVISASLKNIFIAFHKRGFSGAKNIFQHTSLLFFTVYRYIWWWPEMDFFYPYECDNKIENIVQWDFIVRWNSWGNIYVNKVIKNLIASNYASYTLLMKKKLNWSKKCWIETKSTELKQNGWKNA